MKKKVKKKRDIKLICLHSHVQAGAWKFLEDTLARGY